MSLVDSRGCRKVDSVVEGARTGVRVIRGFFIGCRRCCRRREIQLHAGSNFWTTLLFFVIVDRRFYYMSSTLHVVRSMAVRWKALQSYHAHTSATHTPTSVGPWLSIIQGLVYFLF